MPGMRRLQASPMRDSHARDTIVGKEASMNAIQLTALDQPLEFLDVPVPTVGPTDVLVRIAAAGICHSDVHYWQGLSPAGPLPHTLGHEIAGIIEAVGDDVFSQKPGDRVALHYLVTCGQCEYCRSSSEQFCEEGLMLGKDLPGGYAEYVAVPAINAVPVPDAIPLEQAAVSMCSSATVFHALRKSRLSPGEAVAVFGVGGLGMSAIQLSRVFGATDVYAVDINAERLALAERLGAIPIDASSSDPVAEIRRRADRGVDVSLGLIGSADALRQGVQALRPYGRSVVVGIADQPLELDTYRDLLGVEAELIGCSDHLLEELPTVLRHIETGVLNLEPVITETIPLDASAANRVFANLHAYGAGVRTVIVPE